MSVSYLPSELIIHHILPCLEVGKVWRLRRVNWEWQNCIHQALGYRRTDEIQPLLERCIQEEQEDNVQILLASSTCYLDGQPARLAIDRGSVSILRQLLLSQRLVLPAEQLGGSLWCQCLCWATSQYYNQSAISWMLLNELASLGDQGANTACHYNQPLHNAAEAGQIEVVHWLLNQHAVIMAGDLGTELVWLALQSGSIQMLQLVVSNTQVSLPTTQQLTTYLELSSAHYLSVEQLDLLEEYLGPIESFNGTQVVCQMISYNQSIKLAQLLGDPRLEIRDPKSSILSEAIKHADYPTVQVLLHDDRISSINQIRVVLDRFGYMFPPERSEMTSQPIQRY